MTRGQSGQLAEPVTLNLWLPGRGPVALDGKGIAVGLDEGTPSWVLVGEAAKARAVGVLEYASRLAAVRGVLPDEWRRDERMAEVPPLPPREVVGREVRWAVATGLWLVHSDEAVYLRRAATGDWEGTAYLSFDEARRFVRALVALWRWQQWLAQTIGCSAEEERMRLEEELRGAPGTGVAAGEER